MSVSPRTQLLIDRVSKDHPLSPSMKAAMIAALAASEGFAGHKIALASDRRMTPLGQRQALRDALTGNHGKAWARAKAPVTKARKEITARRDALVVKAVDPANLAAALERQEIRAWVRQLDPGVRQSVVLGTKDRRILEAMLTAPPELSGIAGAGAALEIENRYIELTYPDELTAIEAMDAVVSEAEAGLAVARNDMQAVVDHLHPHEFGKLVQSLEVAGPWLTVDRKQVIEIGADGFAKYRPASADDVNNGRVYNEAEFRASRTA
jgi:hypothetical protein